MSFDPEIDELVQEARNDQFKVASLLLTVAAQLVISQVTHRLDEGVALVKAELLNLLQDPEVAGVAVRLGPPDATRLPVLQALLETPDRCAPRSQ